MNSRPPAPTLDLLRDVLARVISLRDALEVGDKSYAYLIAENLEADLADALEKRAA